MEESGRRSQRPSQAAYTDIDGTVTAYNTIFEFLRFDAAERSCAADAEEFLAGERWADLQAESPDEWHFLEPVASLLEAHSLSGRRLVAVTASFEPALVGNAKTRAVASHAAEHGVDLMASFAYGDHHSDLQFMALAGQSLLVTPAAPATVG